MKTLKIFAILTLSMLTATLQAQEKEKPLSPKGTQVIAHRGHWDVDGSAQNSRRSLQLALDMDIYGSEIDIWLTRDGHLFVNHDASYDGVTLQDATADECRALILKNGEHMPELKDMLALLKKSTTSTKLIIEIKECRTLQQNLESARQTVKAVRKAGMQKKVEYISFSLAVCVEIARLDPTARVAFLSGCVLRTCIKLRGTNDFKKTINEVIQDIREMCGAELCTLMLMDEENGKCNILAKSTMLNSSLKTVTQFTNFYDIALSWRETLGERDCIIIKGAKDMEYISETNNMWYLTLEEAGVESIVLFPLRHNREMIGYIWVTNFNIENTQRIKETLELTSFFLSSEIAGYNMMTRLEHIGYTDLLTGINNRNAMNNRIMDIVSGDETISVPYGVVFADLNGLKRVNDEGGHAAGDLLLKKAALILQEVFIGDSIYRAGGDEFMIIASDISESAFSEKVHDLRKAASDPDSVCFSVGSFYNSSGSDIRDAMRIADEAMYKDKEEYYQKYPERKYR